MKAMILAAGIGKRMLPLTDKIPKPLIQVNKKYLIEYSILALKKAGINQLIINVHHLGYQVKSMLGDGSKWGVSINYSEEYDLLDTGGGIIQAINNNLLGEKPFVVVSSDIITDFDFNLLIPQLSKLAHLILVPNPSFKLNGDFNLVNNELRLLDHNNPGSNYTYANIGIFDPRFFLNPIDKIVPLVKFINRAINNNQITGEVYYGSWKNIGNLSDLRSVNVTS